MRSPVFVVTTPTVTLSASVLEAEKQLPVVQLLTTLAVE